MYEEALNSYQRVNYLTADPLKLVLLCYKGAISNLRIAKEAYVKKDYEQKAKAITKAIDILSELNSSLDMEKGGCIAKNLRSLYNFMTRSLIEADLKKDIAMFDKIIILLEELESAWQGIGMFLVNGKVQTEEHIQPKVPGIARNVSTTVEARAWSA